MGIHQKGNVTTKTKQKALFRNCTKNGINKCLKYCPRQLWSYVYPYIAKIVQLAVIQNVRLQGKTSLELMTGETPDISKYLDFGCYDRVWLKEDEIRDTQIG